MVAVVVLFVEPFPRETDEHETFPLLAAPSGARAIKTAPFLTLITGHTQKKTSMACVPRSPTSLIGYWSGEFEAGVRLVNEAAFASSGHATRIAPQHF